MRALPAVEKLKGDNEDQNVGIAIATRAMTEPLRQIVTNAGEEGSVVLNKVRDGKGTTVTTPPPASTEQGTYSDPIYSKPHPRGGVFLRGDQRQPGKEVRMSIVFVAAAEYLLEQFGNCAVLGAAQGPFLPNQLSQVESRNRCAMNDRGNTPDNDVLNLVPVENFGESAQQQFLRAGRCSLRP